MTRPNKVIYQTGTKGIPDDHGYRFKLYANLRPPELMNITFVMMHGGSEEVIIRGDTRELLQPIVDELITHPRLRRIEIIDEISGNIETIKPA